MKPLRALLFSLLIFTLPAHAADDVQDTDSDYSVLQKFSSSLNGGYYDDAKTYISSRSHTLFERYKSHDLGDMTPQSYSILGKSREGNYRYLRIINNTTQQKQSAARVAFVTENNQPKIDLPETLRLGFGENWEKKINFIEKSYMIAKLQFGEEKSREILQNLIKSQ